MPAAFSRLQLAAALLEYDNDLDNPDAPRRSAQESAIFAHLRRNPAAPPQVSSRQSDYLGVSLPSEPGSLGGRESALGTRRSRGSIDALQNPFGADSNDEEEEVEEEMEVDLSSWGLDAFMPKDKSKKGKGKASSATAAPSMTTVRSHVPSTNAEQLLLAPRRAISSSRSMSLGGSLDFIRETTATASLDSRRRSIASPLDVVNMDPSRVTIPRLRASSASLMRDTAELSQGIIPFPSSSSSVRATSPGPTETIAGRRPHERTFSMASMNSRMVLTDVKEESVRTRPLSTYEPEEALTEDNPFALEPPSQTSRFDPKHGARTRTISTASMGTHMLLNDDHNSVMTGTGDNFARERRYSTTLELLRPKVLVMPSPLQSIAPPEPPQIDNRVRDGFLLSKDGPPLPPGARTSRRMSTMFAGLDVPPPIASNSFTPNPLNDLTYAQKLFRNTLAVDGHLDAYPEDLPRAMEDGEQIQLYPVTPEVEEEVAPAPPVETPAMKRLPGKLYGKSLIDDLEMRKANMRSKQRVFTGDQRPSMMARGDLQRSSTLIDPATLATRPNTQYMSLSASGERMVRRNSSNIKPLLSFENDKIPQSAPMPNRPMNSRSVFGVDTLWEREMMKLREIEAREKIEEEERKRQEEGEELRKAEKRDRKKRKDKKQDVEQPPETLLAPCPQDVEPRVSIEPPVLPTIERATMRRPPPPEDDDASDSETDEDNAVASPRRLLEPGWHAESSDEDSGPRRTTGVGLRYPNRNRVASPPAEAESDEDLPLAVTIDKAFGRTPGTQIYSQDSEDEEKPLSSLLGKAKVKALGSPPLDINFDKLSLEADRANHDEDDDEPLALRASRIPQGFNNRAGDDDDDDDRPLALHPEQQRRTQYGMFAQQQQMMMQAQIQNNMFFNQPMMGSGFFGSPMAPPMMNPMNSMMMMQPPMPLPSPPPIHDAAKYGRVDKWRRDVAVEGER